MVQWFKKQQKCRTLSYNKAQLQTELNNLSSHIYAHKEDTGLKILLEVIELARNIQVLESYGNKSPEYAKGRYDAFSDILTYVERAIAARKEEIKRGEAKPHPHSIHAIRRTNNMAGPAF